MWKKMRFESYGFSWYYDPSLSNGIEGTGIKRTVFQTIFISVIGFGIMIGIKLAGVIGGIFGAGCGILLLVQMDKAVRWFEFMLEIWPIKRIKKMEIKRDINGLVSKLNYRKDNRVPQAAAIALGHLNALKSIDNSAIEPLIQTLRDRWEHVRRDAAFILRQIDWTPSNDTEKWLYFLGVGDSRKEKILEGVKEIEPILQALNDNDSDVRWLAAKALGIIRKKEAVKPLNKALMDNHASVRFAVASSLDKIGWLPSNDTEKAYYLIAKKEWDAMARLTNSSCYVEHLISIFFSVGDLDWDGAAKVLGKTGDERAVDFLLGVSCHSDPDIRLVAIQGLGETRNIRAADRLLKVMDEESGYRLMCAIMSLGKLKDTRAVEPIFHAYKKRLYGTARYAAIYGLRDIGDTRSKKYLSQIVNELEIEYSKNYGSSEPFYRGIKDTLECARTALEKCEASLDSHGAKNLFLQAWPVFGDDRKPLNNQ